MNTYKYYIERSASTRFTDKKDVITNYSKKPMEQRCKLFIYIKRSFCFRVMVKKVHFIFLLRRLYRPMLCFQDHFAIVVCSNRSRRK